MNKLSSAYDTVIMNIKNASYNTLLYFFYIFITFFGLIGIYIIISIILNVFNMPLSIYIALGAFLVALFITIHSGYKAALLKYYFLLKNNKRAHLIGYLRDASTLAPKALIVGLMRLITLIIFLSPIGLVVYFVPNIVNNIIFIAISIIYSLIMLTFISYIYAIIFFLLSYSNKLRKSLIFGLKLAFKKFISLFPYYFAYGIIVLIGFIPIINIATIILFYPTMCIALFDKIREGGDIL